MFRRRARRAGASDSPGANAYRGLREQMLNLDPTEVGLAPTGPQDRLWGCVMETGYPNGAATLV